MTLLEIVQDILSDLDSDEVNSISDTVESLQVAQIVKTTYFNIIDGKDWPHLYQLFQIEASGDINKPTHMRLPDNIVRLDWLKYNKKQVGDSYNKFVEITYKTPIVFLSLLDARHSDATDILVVNDSSGVKLNIKTDVAPSFYTSFDNEHIILDSYDSAVDNTLQVAKTQGYGMIYPTWTMDDSFTPDLPTQSFSYLLNEAKSVAFVALKQAPNPKAEQHSVTQRRRMSQEAWRLQGGITIPHYGRKK